MFPGVWFPWLQSRSHDPWTLLHLATSDQRTVRLLGVRALADDHSWNGKSLYSTLMSNCKVNVLSLFTIFPDCAALHLVQRPSIVHSLIDKMIDTCLSKSISLMNLNSLLNNDGILSQSYLILSYLDAEYQMLAQRCDSRTSVGLARTFTADPRFFLTMPKLQEPTQVWYFRTIL